MAVLKFSANTFAKGLSKYQTFWDQQATTYVSSGLALYLDAGHPASYSGSGTTWYDLSGNSNNGTINGGVTYSSSNGGYLTFNGSTGYVNCGNGSSINISGSITINVLFNASVWNTGTWYSLVEKGDSSYRFQNANGTKALDFGTSGLSEIDTNGQTELTTGTWYMGTAVWDGTNKYVYLNGVVDKKIAVSGTLSTNSYNLYIAENSQATGRFFNGSIAAVQIYNRALSQAEVTQNFNHFKTRFGI